MNRRLRFVLVESRSLSFSIVFVSLARWVCSLHLFILCTYAWNVPSCEEYEKQEMTRDDFHQVRGEGRRRADRREKCWRVVGNRLDEWRVSHLRGKNNRKNEKATDRKRKDKRQRKCGVIWKIVVAWPKRGMGEKWLKVRKRNERDWKRRGEKDEKENARRVLGGDSSQGWKREQAEVVKTGWDSLREGGRRGASTRPLS